MGVRAYVGATALPLAVTGAVVKAETGWQYFVDGKEACTLSYTIAYRGDNVRFYNTASVTAPDRCAGHSKVTMIEIRDRTFAGVASDVLDL